MITCSKILFILWWVALLCGICLLLLCIVFGNSPPNSVYHELVLCFGTIGAFLVFFACLSKPKIRELLVEDFRNYQRQELLVNNEHVPKMITKNNIESNNNHNNGQTSEVIIDEPVNSV